MINFKSFIIFLLVFLHAIDSKLIFMQSVTRHGGRYPKNPHKLDHSWFVKEQNIKGQLTDQGRHQHYVLGRIFYQKYWKSLFGGTEYQFKYHSSQIEIRTIALNRTIESINSLILGLYEALPASFLPKKQREKSLPAFANASDYDIESNQNVFPVFGSKNQNYKMALLHQQRGAINIPRDLNYAFLANPYDEGDFLHKCLKEQCPMQKYWIADNLASQRLKSVIQNDQIQAFLNKLGEIVKEKDVDFHFAAHLIDNYRSLRNLGLPYLEFFDQPQNQRIIDYISMLQFLARPLMTQEQIQVCNSILIDKTVQNLRNGVNGKGPKMVLYNGHETTIMALLTALKMTSFECVTAKFFNQTEAGQEVCIDAPPFNSASLFFELYEENANYHIKILYNGVYMKIPICGNKIACTLQEFQKWAGKFCEVDPNTLCGIQDIRNIKKRPKFYKSERKTQRKQKKD